MSVLVTLMDVITIVIILWDHTIVLVTLDTGSIQLI